MQEINSKIYDSHIISQGLQFQVDTYYQPRELSEKRRIEIILGYTEPKPDEKILDIGCGVGTFAFHTAKKGAVSIGIDYSHKSIEAANVLSHRYDLKGRVYFVVGDAIRLPFPDAFFEKIMAIDFIEHITLEDKKALLKEMKRVLKNKGKIIIFTPNKIREDMAHLYHMLRHFLFKTNVPANPLHFGLINRVQFEKLLKESGLSYEFFYKDLTRPCLAQWSLLNRILSLNLLWVIYKK